MNATSCKSLQRLIIATLPLWASLFGGCQTIRAGAHFDETTDFGRYQSFSWIDEEPLIVGADETGIIISPLTKSKVQQAIREGFEQIGYRYAASPDDADFVVAYTIGTRREVSVTSYPSAYYGQWGWHVRGSRYYIHEVQSHNYTKGTLGVDVFDRESKKPVWHGFAEKTITSGDRSDPMPTIVAGVSKMLESFPRQESIPR